MSGLASLSRMSLQGFEQLSSNLTDAKPEHLQLMSLETIHAQAGKLRVWCGNLGALQTGYSSLDYRLRESTVMQSAVSTLLQQLSNTLHESSAVTSGKRLPFEDQPKPADLSEESTDEDSDSDFCPRPRKELAMRLSSITDCLSSLYRLSYKIRDPTLRPTTTKAILYKEVDPETNIDVFDKLHELDMMHTHELLLLLRQGRRPPEGFEDFIAPRLATSITLRRRCFKYWQKHSRKLSGPAEIGEVIPAQPDLDLSNMQLGPGPGNADGGLVERLSPFPVAREAATILSKTDATPYDATQDDRTERETVISLASTALDADGKGIGLPGPPPDAKRGLGFMCPYCHVLCPAKQGRGKVWRQHVLHDLQPYVCTYQGCPRPNELYRTRNQWVKHEDSTHRRCWRCFEHPDHVYTSESGLRGHWATDHAGTMTEEQIEDMVDVFSSTLIDDREHCPICFLTQPFTNGMANHLANHLERAALFALPRNQPDAGGSEDGSLDSHGNRAGDRSSRDTEGTLSSFKGTVAYESRNDSEADATEASARMERRLRGGNSTASHDGDPDDEDPPSVGPADAFSEVTDQTDENEDFTLSVERARALVTQLTATLVRILQEQFDIEELPTSPSRLSKNVFVKVGGQFRPLCECISRPLLGQLVWSYGEKYPGGLTNSELQNLTSILMRWAICFRSVTKNSFRALSLKDFEMALHILGQLRPRAITFNPAEVELAFRAYTTPAKEGVDVDGFIRCCILLDDSSVGF